MLELQVVREENQNKIILISRFELMEEAFLHLTSIDDIIRWTQSICVALNVMQYYNFFKNDLIYQWTSICNNVKVNSDKPYLFHVSLDFNLCTYDIFKTSCNVINISHVLLNKKYLWLQLIWACLPIRLPTSSPVLELLHSTSQSWITQSQLMRVIEPA